MYKNVIKQVQYSDTPVPERAKRGGKSDIDEPVIGFKPSKIFDKSSIFYGIPSLNTIGSYGTLVLDNLHLLPTSQDDKLIKTFKMMSIGWMVIRNIQVVKPGLFNRDDLTEIDFGSSVYIISRLLNEVTEPDEVFRPHRTAPFIPSYDLYRYTIDGKFLYFINEKGSDIVNKVLATESLSKDDILEFLWQRLGRIIQLRTYTDDGTEYADGLTYVKTKLTEKKIFGSSNDLIEKLKNEFSFFKTNKISRGCLLIGKPGTGKTGIVNAIVNSTECRVCIIGGIDDSSTVEEMESLFINMRPDFIILDDCDRSSKSPETIKAMLSLLEKVKDETPHTNFLFTANTFSGILQDDAVTRKGRIDQIYEVPEPCELDRREIFKRYSQEMQITLNDDDLEKCVELSDGMTGADIKELCIQLKLSKIDEVFKQALEITKLKKKYSGDEYSDEGAKQLSLVLQRLRNTN